VEVAVFLVLFPFFISDFFVGEGDLFIHFLSSAIICLVCFDQFSIAFRLISPLRPALFLRILVPMSLDYSLRVMVNFDPKVERGFWRKARN
jgi:hypothetical protein